MARNTFALAWPNKLYVVCRNLPSPNTTSVTRTSHCIPLRNQCYLIIFDRNTSQLAFTGESICQPLAFQAEGVLPLPASVSHYSDVIISAMASQIIGVSIVYSNVCSGADRRKHQSSASLAFVRGIHRGPVNSPHKGPVTRKMFLFDDVIMVIHFSSKQFNIWLP